MEINYRELKREDFPDIMELIDDAWHFDNFINDKKCKYHAIKSFMLGAIINKNYSQVAVMDGKAVGVLLGRVPKLRGFLKNAKYIPSAIYHGNASYYVSKENRKMIVGFMKMLKLYKELLKKAEEKFDGELEFFITHSKVQGKGVGKTLWQNYQKFCKMNNVKKIYLYTDDHCNFGFYEHNGFERKLYEPFFFDTYKGKQEFNVYLYTKDID